MVQKLIIIIGTVISIALIWGALLANGNSESSSENIREEAGAQIIHILARGGYSPRNIIAKADTLTKLEIETSGTYDCSSSLVIPALNFQKLLASTDQVTIDVPPQNSGSSIVGLCGMGMYNFEIQFE